MRTGTGDYFSFLRLTRLRFACKIFHNRKRDGTYEKTTKIGIIGAGHVGSHVASSLMTQGLCDEIVLLDTDEGKARRHADDIADSVAYMPLPAKIYAGGYEALADADIVVLSACSTIFEQDRLLELNATVTVIAEIAPQLTASGFWAS